MGNFLFDNEPAVSNLDASLGMNTSRDPFSFSRAAFYGLAAEGIGISALALAKATRDMGTKRSSTNRVRTNNGGRLGPSLLPEKRGPEPRMKARESFLKPQGKQTTTKKTLNELNELNF